MTILKKQTSDKVETPSGTIEYSIKGSRRKTIGINVYPDEHVSISAPYWTTKAQIREIVHSKAAWIQSKIEHFKNTNNIKLDSFLSEGSKVMLLGKEYLLVRSAANSKVIRDDNCHEIMVWYSEELNPAEIHNEVRNQLEPYFKQIACQVVAERLKYYSNLLEVTPSRVVIKSQKSRWGTCTGKNAIYINWKIISAPLDIIDYLVVHELAHIKVKNHSKQFWDTVESILPDHKARRKWLKANGRILGF